MTTLDHRTPGTEPGDGEETVLVADRAFARRRLRARIRRLRPFLIAAAVVLATAVGIWLVFYSSVLTVRGVEVTGSGKVSQARIERAARVPLDEQLIRVDLAAIQARVEAIPAIASAEVSRSWPHTIHISVTERVPIAVVDRGTVLQAVDVNGVLFDQYAHAPADLPVVRTEPDVKAAALAEAAKVVTSLRPDIAAEVEHVDVTSIDEITLRLSGGITVVWGSADSSADKAEVLAGLLAHVTKKHPISTINVVAPEHPTTR